MDQRPYVRPVTLKLLQENIGKTFEDTSIGNTFLNKTLIAPEIRALNKKALHSK
jgi:hypothetical protein